MSSQTVRVLVFFVCFVSMSDIQFSGLATGSLLYEFMHARQHPLGAVNGLINYIDVYNFLNCKRAREMRTIRVRLTAFCFAGLDIRSVRLDSICLHKRTDTSP